MRRLLRFLVEKNETSYGDISTIANKKLISEFKTKIKIMNNDIQIINIVSKILKIDKSQINLDTRSDDIINWDSLAQINIILTLEKISIKK